MNLIVWIVVGFVVVSIGSVVLLSVILVWQDQKTRGLAYYGLPRRERNQFKRMLKRWAVLLHPIIVLQAKFATITFEKARFVYRGVAGPRGTGSDQ